jgi:hypothetical protein
MISPETNELAIARRILGMADRLGHSAIPEEIAGEARSAFYELEECRASDLKLWAQITALRLFYFQIGSKSACVSQLREAVSYLRCAIEQESRFIEGREAA